MMAMSYSIIMIDLMEDIDKPMIRWEFRKLDCKKLGNLEHVGQAAIRPLFKKAFWGRFTSP